MPITRQQPRMAGLQLRHRTSAFSPTAVGVKLVTGTYTGNGAATQAVVGVGFRPQSIIIYKETSVTIDLGFKNIDDVLNALVFSGGSWFLQVDHIISFDADGFTVGDGTGGIANILNLAAQVYTYIAFGGSGPLRLQHGIYTGDGNATQAIAGLGFSPLFAIVYFGGGLNDFAAKSNQDGVNSKYYANGWTGFVTVADFIISLDADGFTVGDGTGFPWGNQLNILGQAYTYTAFGGIATGTYTGDGNATQAIVGVGFTPRFVIVYDKAWTINMDFGMKCNQDGVNAKFMDGSVGRWWRYLPDMVISLDADGFTVGDGTGLANVFNRLGVSYTYIAFR